MQDQNVTENIPIQTGDSSMQGNNARKVNCGCVYSAYIFLWAEFVNKNRCTSVRLVSKENKSI